MSTSTTGEAHLETKAANLSDSESSGRRFLSSRTMRRFKRNKGGVIGLAILIFYALFALSPIVFDLPDPLKQNLSKVQQPPNAENWLGTDELGRDILSRLIVGARLSILITSSAVVLALLLGTIVGMVAAYYGGYVETLLMRVMDILLALPGILVAIIIVAIAGPSLGSLVVAIGISTIPMFALVARGSTLSILSSEYITAARSIGNSDAQVIRQHLLPNIVSPLIVQSTLRLATAILTASGLSFLGLGPQPPTPEWGSMLATGRAYMSAAPHIAIMPGVAIMLIVFGFNLFGDGLRDALDPKRTD